jgi:hypothetical protein
MMQDQRLRNVKEEKEVQYERAGNLEWTISV